MRTSFRDASEEIPMRALVLAGGKGTRFVSESGSFMPKVLRSVCGRPVISFAIDACKEAGASEIGVIVGYRSDEVTEALGADYQYFHQPAQNGSGDAVRCALDFFKDFSGVLIVTCGDSPLFTSDTIKGLAGQLVKKGSAICLATCELENPTGYGRIVEDDAGNIRSIVEEKCADENQKLIRKISGGAYAFDASWLAQNIDKMQKNEAGEYNLTDMVRVACLTGENICSSGCSEDEIHGVNTPSELERVEELLKKRNQGSKGSI